MLTASCIFIILGTLCLVGARIWQMGILKDEKYKGKAAGTIAEIVSGTPDKEGLASGIHDYLYPVVAFYANGHLYKLKYPKGSYPSRYKVKEKIEIRYDEKDPTLFEIYEGQKKSIIANIIYYAGFGFCCIGGIFFLLFATRY